MSRSNIRLAGLLIVFALAAQGCTLFGSLEDLVARPFGRPSAASTAIAQATDGPFTLTLELDKNVWRSSEAIVGKATLSYSGQGTLEIWTSAGGALNFGYLEVGGDKAMGPAWDMACAQRFIDPGKPMVSPLGRSGGFSADEANAGFYRQFFADPEIHLPAGTWKVTAYAELMEKTCGGHERKLQASLVIEVAS